MVNFYARSWKSKNWHIDWIRLSKVYKYLDEKVQKIYVSWNWRVMRSLKKNRLLAPKMTWEIWWILMRAVASLEIYPLMCYFYQLAYKFLAQKAQNNYLSWHWKRPKLWKLTFYLKIDMRNLVNFNLSSGKVWKFALKGYRGVELWKMTYGFL